MNKLITILLFSSAFLHAEVFSLWDFNGGGDALSTDSPDAVLAPAKVRDEQIIADGRKMTMSVSMIRTSLDNCLTTLRQRFPNAQFAANNSSILMELKLKNGMRKRIYLVSIDGIYPVISFSMTLPPKGKERLSWPAEFPMPPGGTPVSVIRFPDRNAVYGSFKAPGRIENALSYMASALKAAGWKAATAEHQAGMGGTGEIFLKSDPSRMLILGFSKDKDGNSCLCTIYSRANSK